MLDIDDWPSRGQNAAPLATHIVFQPTSSKDPLSRDNAISIRKLDGEGTSNERQRVLGWLIDTFQFRIYLPTEKASQWIADLNDALKRGNVNSKTIECIIGCLNHTAHIIPQACYFLNQLRFLFQRCSKYGCQQMTSTEKGQHVSVDRNPPKSV